MKKSKVRVLVVDDSAYARVNISKHLNADPQIEVIGTARDGIEALRMIQRLKPSVVTLDVSMPRMDGLTALEHIMSECPTPVVMLSVLTAKGAHETIRALELGAADFFLKPSVATPAGTRETLQELRTKVKLAAQVPVSKLHTATQTADEPSLAQRARGVAKQDRTMIIIVGCSTGGPKALSEILPRLPADLPASLLIVQHMHQGFTKSLAERLDSLCEIPVQEAHDGDLLLPGHGFLAPGDYHMTVSSDRTISLNQNRPDCHVRPSVNVTMASVAKNFGPEVLCMILTGMGHDGTRGAALVRAAGGRVFVEDESTCVVYGMPKSIVNSGNADKILSRDLIAAEIIHACNKFATTRE
jgi:two-component system chemotaxis response regulator CheB